MIMYTSAEENYIKCIYKLSAKTKSGQVSTNEIADKMNTAAASVTDMIKKLSKKEIVEYRRYQGVKLTNEGSKLALLIIRKHRLWEVFLVNKLNFNWDEVHDVAEQLEHIKSEKLIDNLEKFLGFPDFDPHGDPIPDRNGKFNARKKILLSEITINRSSIVVELADTSDNFLRYLDKVGINLGSTLKVLEHNEFDNSIEVLLNEKDKLSVSQQVATNIYVSN